MSDEPARDWLREKEVLNWQTWLTPYILRQLIGDGTLKLKVGGIPTDCDVWQRRPGPRFAKFYRSSKLRQLCAGANGNNTL
jgi:hypothetical protein